MRLPWFWYPIIGAIVVGVVWLASWRDARGATLAFHVPAPWACIQRGETPPPFTAWRTESGNGFHGGLQMDADFEATYGPEFLRRWGHAGHWPVWAQVLAATRARDGWHGHSARGYHPWPKTAAACGLI